jgi:hypothetical protein
VLSYSQMERVRAGEVIPEDEETNGDPLRVYDGTQGKPGCLFTRSIGDSYAKRLGVWYVHQHKLHIHRDGIWALVCVTPSLCVYVGVGFCTVIGKCSADPEVCTHHVAWGQDLVISLGSHGVFDLLDGPSLASVLEQCPTPFDACKAVGDHCIKQVCAPSICESLCAERSKVQRLKWPLVVCAAQGGWPGRRQQLHLHLPA